MTARPLGTYPRIRQADRRTDLDRRTWAGEDKVVMTYDLLNTGTGTVETEMLDFGLVFEGPPFFSYGVEVIPGNELVAGQYPQVTAGVREWLVSTADDEYIESAKLPFYLGASLWLGVEFTVMPLRFRLSFEGISMRNVEHFRGLNG